MKSYKSFLKQIRKFVPEERIYTDDIRRLAWGTDAGFYRLIPQIVIRTDGEEEIVKILKFAGQLKLPVTFRAAGTSLSGQSISDSILLVAGKHWEKYSISPDGKTITLQPGIIGQRVNELLKPYGHKFSPDPASLKSAMVGGIVMNNASGMCCGTHANSDKMILSARLILPDGTILDTGDEESKKQFLQTHPDFINKIRQIKQTILDNPALDTRIRYKYSIKNVTGLNLLPFVSFEDPFDIITHLLIGSEGILAFLSEATFRTEHDYPYKASAMLYFEDIKEACRAVQAIKKLKNEQNEWIVKSAELLDSKSLFSVKDTTGEGLTAVLTETKADTREELSEQIKIITSALNTFKTYIPVYFTEKEEEYNRYWAIRSGIFPSVGGERPPGTTSLIEDVAFHLKDLPEATADLQQLLVKHGYTDACIYGHALEGNYHFIINQSFDTKVEVNRYEKLMDEVKKLVLYKYDGSLKAEHGTGRNMAPFVAEEWGEEAFAIMKEIKRLFDPHNLLNPGVIFNPDPQCHIKNFKPLPLTHPKVNKCIECGFCEVNCLSCGFTFSSRQRIVVRREITRLQQSGENSSYLRTLKKKYKYLGDATCAGDGLCAMSCPMGINTGDLTHAIREEKYKRNYLVQQLGRLTATNLERIKSVLRMILSVANLSHKLTGTNLMSRITRGLHNYTGIPLWTAAMPKPIPQLQPEHIQQKVYPADKKYVVYFPSCINQTMGLPADSKEKDPLTDKMISLLNKAGYEIIFPDNLSGLCCGTIWESKGLPEVADSKTKELEKALWKASKEGEYPVLCDQSPCLYRMRHKIEKLKLYEPVEFIYTYLLDRLQFTPVNRPVAVHVTCSMRKMNLDKMIMELAGKCSTRVVCPEQVGCCGFAGDKGFTHPELNQYALRHLRSQLQAKNIQDGYSNSHTCEIGLTTHSGVDYRSIIYLVDECTKRLD